MPSRFEQYRVKNGDNFGDPGLWNERLRDLDLRLASQENIEKTWQAALEELQRVGLTRINEVLLPVYNEIQNLADLGAMFTAHSDTDLNIEPGLKRFTVREEDRDAFAPAAYVAAFIDGDLSKAMMGQTVSYDRPSGILEVDVDSVEGSGSHAGWVLHASSATDYASAALEAETWALDAMTARDSTILLRDEASNTKAASESARDVAQICRDGTQQMRDDTEAALQATKNAVASMSQVYLGAYLTAPTTDLNSAPLVNGAQYFDLTNGQLMTYHNGGWIAAVVPVGSEVTQVFGRAGPVSAQDGDYDAGKISVTPAGGITEVRVQAALAGLDTRKVETDVTISGGTGLTGGGNLSANRSISFDTAWGDARYALASHETSFGELTGKPTTIAGYGIGNAYTKTEIDTKFDNLVGGATGIADTLGELQALISDNDVDISAIYTQIASKLNASSVSAFGLTLLDDTSDSAARSTLGLGSAATYAHSTYALAGHNHSGVYLAATGTAVNADKVDGYHASSFPKLTDSNTFTNTNYFNDWVRVTGQHGLYFQDFSGGWFMRDTTWIRTYGNKSIYTNGSLRANTGVYDGSTSRCYSPNNPPPEELTYIESANLVINLNAQTIWVHGQGSIPKQFGVKLVCVSADQGYLVGDVISVGGADDYYGVGSTSLVALTSQIFYGWRNNIRIGGRSGSGYISPDRTKWRAVLWGVW